MTMGLTIQSKPTTSSSNELPQFLDLEPTKFQELYSLFTPLKDTTSSQEIKEALASHISSWGIPQKTAQQISSAFYTHYCSTSATAPAPAFLSAAAPTSEALISRQDLEYYIAALNTDPDLPLQIRRALLTFAVFYRRNYHPKKWVRYDRKSILFLAGLSDMSSSSQEELMTTLHKDFGFELRVIGSKSPVSCFYFEWMAEQPFPGLDPSNPLIDLGPYTPQTIADAANKTPDELYDLIELALAAANNNDNNNDDTTGDATQAKEAPLGLVADSDIPQ
jgi:hypothetical protein